MFIKNLIENGLHVLIAENSFDYEGLPYGDVSLFGVYDNLITGDLNFIKVKATLALKGQYDDYCGMSYSFNIQPNDLANLKKTCHAEMINFLSKLELSDSEHELLEKLKTHNELVTSDDFEKMCPYDLSDNHNYCHAASLLFDTIYKTTKSLIADQ